MHSYQHTLTHTVLTAILHIWTTVTVNPCIESPRLLLVQLSHRGNRGPASIQDSASISTCSFQQTDGRQHVTAVSLSKQYTKVQKVDSQAEPTFETQLVFKARLLFEVWLLLVQSSQTPSLYSRPGLYSRIYGNQCHLDYLSPFQTHTWSQARPNFWYPP